MVVPTKDAPYSGGMFSSKNMHPIYKVYPYIKIRPLNIADNLMYTLEFQTQRHYPINLSTVAVTSEI